MSKIISRVVLVCLCAIVGMTVQAVPNQDDVKIIATRIKPIGQVNTKTLTANAQGNADKPLQLASANKGEATYNQYCVVCHNAGVAGAPKKGDAGAWKKRSSNIDTLVTNATKGMNAMPPKGTCATCSKEDLKAAILYMKK